MSRKRKAGVVDDVRKRPRPTVDRELFQEICSTRLFRPPIKRWSTHSRTNATQARAETNAAEIDASEVVDGVVKSTTSEEGNGRLREVNVQQLFGHGAHCADSPKATVNTIHDFSRQHGQTYHRHVAVQGDDQRKSPVNSVRKRQTAATGLQGGEPHLIDAALRYSTHHGSSSDGSRRHPGTRVASIPSSLSIPTQHETRQLLRRFLDDDEEDGSSDESEDGDADSDRDDSESIRSPDMAHESSRNSPVGKVQSPIGAQHTERTSTMDPRNLSNTGFDDSSHAGIDDDMSSRPLSRRRHKALEADRLGQKRAGGTPASSPTRRYDAIPTKGAHHISTGHDDSESGHLGSEINRPASGLIFNRSERNTDHREPSDKNFGARKSPKKLDVRPIAHTDEKAMSELSSDDDDLINNVLLPFGAKASLAPEHSPLALGVALESARSRESESVAKSVERDEADASTPASGVSVVAPAQSLLTKEQNQSLGSTAWSNEGLSSPRGQSEGTRAGCRSGRRFLATEHQAQYHEGSKIVAHEIYPSRRISDIILKSGEAPVIAAHIAQGTENNSGEIDKTDAYKAAAPQCIDHAAVSEITPSQEENIYGMVDALAKNILSDDYFFPSSKHEYFLDRPATYDAKTLIRMKQGHDVDFMNLHIDCDQICMQAAVCETTPNGTTCIPAHIPAHEGPADDQSDCAASVSSCSSLSEISDTDLEVLAAQVQSCAEPVTTSEGRPRAKRRMTGNTSKHFSPVKRKQKVQTGETPQRAKRASINLKAPETGQSSLATHYNDIEGKPEQSTVSIQHPKAADDVPESSEVQTDLKHEDDIGNMSTAVERRSARLVHRSTGKVSEHFHPERKIDLAVIDRVDLYNTTAGNRRKTAGTSRCPVPSIREEKFGIVQEKLWREPFWLLIAVIFLNQTTGRAAVPVFWRLKARYPDVKDIANADQAEIFKMIQHLGFGQQRSRKFIQLANIWLTDPPMVARRHRTLHYPAKGDGKEIKKGCIVEEDSELTPGALEIGHLPGCGRYAWDSWRIFCRDVLRGVADDYNGSEAQQEDFQPEWQRVLPEDKELRACLRWMWLREGYIWDPLTGEKRSATKDEMNRAIEGEIEIDDPKERKFAAQAANTRPAEVNDGGDLKHDDTDGLKEEDDHHGTDSASLSSLPDELDSESDDLNSE